MSAYIRCDVGGRSFRLPLNLSSDLFRFSSSLFWRAESFVRVAPIARLFNRSAPTRYANPFTCILCFMPEDAFISLVPSQMI